jgi:hypothetical protein
VKPDRRPRLALVGPLVRPLNHLDRSRSFVFLPITVVRPLDHPDRSRSFVSLGLVPYGRLVGSIGALRRRLQRSRYPEKRGAKLPRVSIGWRKTPRRAVISRLLPIGTVSFRSAYPPTTTAVYSTGPRESRLRLDCTPGPDKSMEKIGKSKLMRTSGAIRR